MFYKVMRIILLVLSLVLVVFIFSPLSLARKTVYVDINSGCLRQRIWVTFFICKENIQETIITQNVVRNGESVRCWRGVSTEPIISCPSVIPWHRLFITAKYAEVPVQLQLLSLIWKGNKETKESKQKIATDIISLWKKTGRDDEATALLMRMFDAYAEEEYDSVMKNPVRSNNSSDGK